MLGPNTLKGCITALITPMRERHGKVVVDYHRLEELVTSQIQAGVSGLLFVATTGQSATLTTEEKVAVTVTGVRTALNVAKNSRKKPVLMAAAGSNSTNEAGRLTRALLDATELDALLHVTGYYNNPPQEGLVAHFEAVADVSGGYGVPVVLYNVPSRTGSDMSAETVATLSKHPWIMGLKEASGNLEKVKDILIRTENEEFVVLSGEDHQVAEIVSMGGTGVISASANRWPAQFERLVSLALDGRKQDAMELQEALLPCIRAVFSAKNPIPLCKMLGSEVRLPLVGVDNLNPETRRKVLASIESSESIKDFPHMDT